MRLPRSVDLRLPDVDLGHLLPLIADLVESAAEVGTNLTQRVLSVLQEPEQTGIGRVRLILKVLSLRL